MTTTALQVYEILDLQPFRGEYVPCQKTSTFEIFGTSVQAFHRIHAMRIAVQKRWNGACECCNKPLRYAHIVEGADGFHCYGERCLNVKALGKEGADKLALRKKIKEKPGRGFVFSAPVPPGIWDLPREKRPDCRIWKAEPRRWSKAVRPVWMLSVWKESLEECLEAVWSIHQNFSLL